MNYIVTWWEGETKQSVACKDAESAQKRAAALRIRSDTYIDRSLVPIRVMSQVVHDRMQAMTKENDNIRCKHGLLQLCVKCLSAAI